MDDFFDFMLIENKRIIEPLIGLQGFDLKIFSYLFFLRILSIMIVA